MMNANDSVNITEGRSEASYTTSFDGNRAKFWILLVLQLLSVPCFLYVFYQFAHNRRLRQTIHHHAIVLLLLVSFLFVTVALSLTLAYMYTSKVTPPSAAFCTLWNCFHYSVNVINLFLMAFASLERHWLIFHPKLVKNFFRRILFHYCPLLFCLVYPPCFYIAAMYIHQCRSYYDYTQLLCKWPCYYYNYLWTQIDLFFNNCTPLFTIPLSCAAIYIRIFIQKRHLKQQRFKWRRDKKLVLQIFALSSLYLAMWMPIQLTGLINAFWLPSFLLQAQIDYMYLFPYFVHLIYPYVVLLSFHQEMIKPSRTTTSVAPGNHWFLSKVLSRNYSRT